MVRNPRRLIISLGIVFVAALVGGLVTYPSITSWYADLTKPFFNPPNWIFGPVWTVLYTLMGVSLYLVWTSKNKQPRRRAFALFGTQLVLNVLWSVAFFGLHWPFVAVLVIVALLAAIVATMMSFWPFSKRAAYLLIPYLLWVSFAMALNISISILNPRPASVTNYDQCVAAEGSTILTIYPSICHTRSGQQFTNPNERVSQMTLPIREWNLVLPLTDSIADAYYTYDDKNGEIFLSTTHLEDLRSRLGGCTSGLHGLYYKHDGDVLVEQSRIETLCLPNATSDTQKIKQIQEQLRAAAKSATTSK
jgi:benzodiazapine receptor